MTAVGEFILVIATYNERATLPTLIARLRERLPDIRILVVDDNSPDGTGQWVREQTRHDPRLQLLHRPAKQGLGVATIAGLQQALTQRPAWIGTMDADLSHRPGDLVRMWQIAAANGYDLIIGSRYVPGGRILNWSFSRRMASRLVNGFARVALRSRARDNSSALRIYRASLLAAMDLRKVDCGGYVYLEQLLFRLQQAGARIHEVPIEFQERAAGKSKVTMSELVRNLRDILWLAMRRR
jgi:dolichol-phosphate mannosyltransferase